MRRKPLTVESRSERSLWTWRPSDRARKSPLSLACNVLDSALLLVANQTDLSNTIKISALDYSTKLGTVVRSLFLYSYGANNGFYCLNSLRAYFIYLLFIWGERERERETETQTEIHTHTHTHRDPTL